MHKTDRIKSIIRQVKEIDLSIGVYLEVDGAPRGCSVMMVDNEPNWKATLLTGLTPANARPSVYASRHHALLWYRATQLIPPNAIDLWVDSNKVLSAQFGGSNLRILMWRPGEWLSHFGMGHSGLTDTR